VLKVHQRPKCNTDAVKLYEENIGESLHLVLWTRQQFPRHMPPSKKKGNKKERIGKLDNIRISKFVLHIVSL
jgi:hypothetical protein